MWFRQKRFVLIPVAGFAFVVARAALGAQFTVTLNPSAAPSAGQAGLTNISVTGSNFPSGTILPANVSVTLTPAGQPSVTAAATAVATILGSTRRVTFTIPSSILVSSPTVCTVSIAGSDSNGNTFSSGNSANLTINPPAQITSVSPNSGQIGTSVSVTISGSYTTFVQGATKASFGPGISVGGGAAGGYGPVTVNSLTSATAQLVISPAAGGGAQTVTVITGAQQEVLANGFTILGTPTLLSMSPNSAQQGQQNISVAITAQFTHFAQGTTTASFGAGITVTSLTVNSAISATAVLSVDPTAQVGGRTVSVQTGVEQESLPNGFTVQAGTPVILSVTQNTGQQGAQNLSVTITGQFTNFVQGITQASFGAGITVGSGSPGGFGPVTVTSVTTATAALGIDAAAAVGGRTVSVQTGTEQESQPNGFTVTTAITVVPKAAITSPASLALFSKSPINVSGTVDNPSDTVVVNGVTATMSSGTWTASGVPLREGMNILTATATDPSGNVGTATESVTLDTTPPTVRILTPSNGAILNTSTLTVAGNTNDSVVGTVNAQQVSVVVNGIAATVSNRSFSISGVPLVQGSNVITAVATDAAGNQSQDQIQVSYQGSIAVQKILIVSGNNQTGVIGTALSGPLVVQAVDANGAPISNRSLTFTVVKSDGSLTSLTQQGQQISLQTDQNGQASAQYTLGTRVGTGNNEVAVSSPGFVGEVTFCETAAVGQPTQIIAAMGDGQHGVVGQPLASPFLVIVLDSGGNPVAGVPVTFTVLQGGGNFNGNTSVTINTDSNGNAAAVLTLGLQEGINNNTVSAAFQVNPGSSVPFTASGVVAGPASNTSVSGIVLDNTNAPIPGATATIEATNPLLKAVTDAQGKFTIPGAPVGTITLLVDGSTSPRSTSATPFPFLAFQMSTIAGQDNTLGMPILLPPLDPNSAQQVGGNQDAVLKMSGVPGYEFTVFAHSVTKPDGTPYVGPMTLSQVHSDKVPMAPPNGTAPNVAGTLQPAGLHFNPPIRTKFPNTSGLAPGTVVDVYSFDHDLMDWVSQGPARVSADGSVVVSDPGFGITKSGWHFAPPPPPPPKNCVGSCDDNNRCTTDSCQDGACVHTPITIPQTKANGCMGCDNGNPIPPKTQAECCSESSFVNDATAAGTVICCNGQKTVCIKPYPPATYSLASLLDECDREHEAQHFGDVDCPTGTNECDTTRPPTKPDRLANAECDAYKVSIACLQRFDCKGVQSCLDTVAGYVQSTKSNANAITPGCIP